MVVRISGSEGISFNDEAFATEPFVTSALEDIPVFQKKIARFTGDGTWTVPAGVTYAIAHMLGGGGGIGVAATAGNGGDSTVAFASGTVVAPGASRVPSTPLSTAAAGPANSGQSAVGQRSESPDRSAMGGGGTSQYTVAGAAVTPAASITVIVGAGGTAGTDGAAGGSGYVYIEYYEEI